MGIGRWPCSSAWVQLAFERQCGGVRFIWGAIVRWVVALVCVVIMLVLLRLAVYYLGMDFFKLLCKRPGLG